MITNKEIEEYIREHAHPTAILVHKPYVAVRLEYTYDGVPLVGDGFAKVSFPDKWDMVFGISLACTRAVRDLRKQEKEIFVDILEAKRIIDKEHNDALEEKLKILRDYISDFPF